mmetsp:Transcript_73920/g.196979  ORF Transcript_73920/g.196979 Transcript_73920/m.196979 type:complete len:291 (+) Transcript_73920:28-900(+)
MEPVTWRPLVRTMQAAVSWTAAVIIVMVWLVALLRGDTLESPLRLNGSVEDSSVTTPVNHFVTVQVLPGVENLLEVVVHRPAPAVSPGGQDNSVGRTRGAPVMVHMPHRLGVMTCPTSTKLCFECVAAPKRTDTLLRWKLQCPREQSAAVAAVANRVGRMVYYWALGRVLTQVIVALVSLPVLRVVIARAAEFFTWKASAAERVRRFRLMMTRSSQVVRPTLLNDPCPVCLEPLRAGGPGAAVMLSCGHGTHAVCYEGWLASPRAPEQLTCAICRGAVSWVRVLVAEEEP